MISSNYVTIEYLLESLFRDYTFELNKYDAAEWIWGCIGYLNIPYGMERKFQEYNVEDYKTFIPTDNYKIQDIKHKQMALSLKRATSLYQINKLIERQNATDSTTLRIEGENYVINDGGPEWDNTAFISGASVPINQESLTYLEQNGSIYYGFREGEVIIAYDAFPLDQYGFPKVPDDAKYIRAIVTFLAYKLVTKMYYAGKATDKMLERIKADYTFAVGAADNKAKLPDYAMMESIKQMRTRLIPFYNLQRLGFETYGNNVYRGLNITDYNLPQ